MSRTTKGAAVQPLARCQDGWQSNESCQGGHLPHQEDDARLEAPGDVKHTADGLLTVSCPLGEDHGWTYGQQHEAGLCSNLLHQQCFASSWGAVQQEGACWLADALEPEGRCSNSISKQMLSATIAGGVVDGGAGHAMA